MSVSTPPQPTSTGLDQNVAGLLSYLFAPISGVIFFVLEKENRFVRFHAMQSIIFGAASFAFWMAYTLLSMVFAFIPILGWIVTSLLGIAAGLGFFAVWVILMVKAFQGEEWELPVLGKYARQYSTQPVI